VQFTLISRDITDEGLRKTIFGEIRRKVASTQTAWIGKSSWIHAHIVRENTWHNFQVLIDSLNIGFKILGFPMADETADQCTMRKELRREYEEALRIHIEHVQTQISECLNVLEAELEIATTRTKNAPSDVRRIAGQIRFLQAYAGGITPFDSTIPNRIEDVETEEVFYGSMEMKDRVAFWKTRWNIDTFVSCNWTFSDVLHFKCVRQI
jgi:hypothetical protein